MGDRLVRLPAKPDDTVRLKPLFDFRDKRNICEEVGQRVCYRYLAKKWLTEHGKYDLPPLKPLYIGVDPAIPGSDKTVVWYDEAATVTRKAWGRLTDD